MMAQTNLAQLKRQHEGSGDPGGTLVVLALHVSALSPWADCERSPFVFLSVSQSLVSHCEIKEPAVWLHRGVEDLHRT